MPSLGDLYVVQFKGNYGGVPTLNVFGYENATLVGSAASLTTGVFTGTNAIWPSWKAAVSSLYTLNSIFTFNTNDASDFFTQVVAQVGARTGDGLAPFDAYSFLFQRATRAVRNGGKRLAGVAEADQANGLVTTGQQTLLNTVATKFGSTVTGTSTDTYVPRILRVTYPHPQTTPPTPGTYTSYPIAGVIFARVSHQSSRHY